MGNDASRALAIVCMLLASRDKANDGTFNGEPEYVKRYGYLNSKPDFKPLIQHGFIELVQDASAMLAPCNTETETETEKEKRNIHVCDDDFLQFWDAYPKKKDKANARKAWDRAKVNGSVSEVMQSLERQKQSEDWKKNGGQFIPLPSTWINARRWEDVIEVDILQEKQERDWI